MLHLKGAEKFFRLTEYRGATCLICRNKVLRKLFFADGILAFQCMDRLFFASERIFADKRVVRHEYAHYLQWKKEGAAYALRYTVMTLTHGYKNNPYEVAARAAERGNSGKRSRRSKTIRGGKG